VVFKDLRSERNTFPARCVLAFLAAVGLVLGVSAPAMAAPDDGTTHTVDSGDTLSEIADEYDVSLHTLFALNGLGPDSVLYPGDVLLLSGDEEADTEADAAPSEDESPAARTHTVRPGDSLGRIAAHYGVPLETVFELNGLDRSSVIYPGDVLLLSDGGSGDSGAEDEAARAGYSINRGPNYTSRVILTFDDCPRSLHGTKDVLAYAERRNIGLVLAPTGDCIRSFSSRYGVNLASWARGNGQYVINHSVSHRDLTTLDCSDGARELGAPGVVTNFGRPPYGALNSDAYCAYAAVGMSPWLWSLDTRDWTGKSQGEVVSKVVANAKQGRTVLMHMQWNGFSPSAIHQMRKGLAERGLGLCRAFPGTSPVELPDSLPC
jgi:LysM repeat protein